MKNEPNTSPTKAMTDETRRLLAEIDALYEKATKGEWITEYRTAHGSSACMPRAENAARRIIANGKTIADVSHCWTDTNVPMWKDGTGPTKKEINFEQHEANADLLTALVNAWPRIRASLSPQAHEDGRDAARYRWLREQSHPWGSKWYSLHVLDQHIDAAMPIREGGKGEE